MQTQELIEQASEYTQTVIDNGFALGTGILMVLVLVIGGVAFFRYLTVTLNKRLDNLILKNTKEHDKVLDRLDELKDKITNIATWVNISIKHKLNGDDNGS